MSDFSQKISQKKLTPAVAFEKMKTWCAYQERAQQEVRIKLAQFGIQGEEAESIICQLIQNNYLNEERFATAFAGGKFRIKKWGRIKIKNELKRHKISDNCISKAMAQIDGDEYFITLEKIILRRMKEEKESNQVKRQYKLLNYAISRGFEKDLIMDAINKLQNNYEH